MGVNQPKTHPVVRVHDDVHLDHASAFKVFEDVPVAVGSAVSVAPFVCVLE